MVLSTTCKSDLHLTQSCASPLNRASKGVHLYFLKILSLSSSALTLFTSYFVLRDEFTATDGLGLLGTVVLIFSTLFTLQPLAIHALTKRYVVEIYYNKKKDEFYAHTLPFFPFINTTIHVFSWEHIHAPDVPGPFTTILIRKPNGKQIPLLFFEDDLMNPEAIELYKRMLGLDESLDKEIEKLRNMKPEGKK